MGNQEIENLEPENNQQANTENIIQDNPELILGKFKNVDELAKAYQNMQTQSGQQSQELGELRKKAQEFENMQNIFSQTNERYNAAKDYLSNVVPKYAQDEYFKNQDFTNLFQEAYNIAGNNLDTDKLVTLLDAYVQSRINLYEKSKSANSENESLKDQMAFSQSETKKSKSTIPNMSNMKPEEIDALVAKYI